MIRVLHVVHKMGYGGIETLIMNIYRNIDRTKIQFDFATNTEEKGEYEEEIKKLGGKIYRLPKRRNHFLYYKKAWNQFFKEHQGEYTAIHMHVSSLTDIQPLASAKKYGVKNRFIHSHNTFQKGTLHNILNRVHRVYIRKYATRLLACSTEAGKYCFGNKKFEVIKNGIDSKKYIYNVETRNKIRRMLNIPEEVLAFVHIGRFSEQKNHTFLIDIFKEIYNRNQDTRLFLVGDGGLKESIENKVKELQLQDKVIFLGIRDNVNEILQAMDAFIFPSLYEGLGIVAIEAQASGLKVFASDVIPKEVKITDLVTFYSLQESSESWAKKILNTINIKQRENTQSQIIEEGYDIMETTNRLEQYYSS